MLSCNRCLFFFFFNNFENYNGRIIWTCTSMLKMPKHMLLTCLTSIFFVFFVFCIFLRSYFVVLWSVHVSYTCFPLRLKLKIEPLSLLKKINHFPCKLKLSAPEWTSLDVSMCNPTSCNLTIFLMMATYWLSFSLLTTIYESMLNQKPQSHSRDYRCDCDKLNTSTTSRESDWIHLIFRKAYLIQTKGTNLSGFLESQPDSCISWTC